jgi:hypothetical protein
MKSRRYLAGFIALFLSLGIFGMSEYVQAAAPGSDQDQQTALIEGAKMMRDGNRMAVESMTTKGIKDADLMAAQKKMQEGYDIVVKGAPMMQGNTMAEGKAMVTRGVNMMTAADKETRAIIDKHGMAKDCSSGLERCELGEQKVKTVFQTYGLQGNWRSGF